MTSEWETVALQDVATIERDVVEAAAIDDGTLYVGLENIKSGGDFIDVHPSTTRYQNRCGIKKIGQCSMGFSDTTLVGVGTIGQSVVEPSAQARNVKAPRDIA